MLKYTAYVALANSVAMSPHFSACHASLLPPFCAGTSHAASRPTFVHQGSQVWVNTEGAYDDTHSHSPRQELHSGKGKDGMGRS
eukprot:1154480-Pelagomonas_calceolata.AAC.3